MTGKATPSFAVFDDYRATVRIVVALRWLLILGWFLILHYRVEHGSTWLVFNLIAAGMAVMNAHVTWRVLTHQHISWRYALALGIVDLIVITVGLSMADGFQNDHLVFYYPALLGLSVMFPGRTSFAVAAVVIAAYVAVSLTVAPSLDTNLTGC